MRLVVIIYFPKMLEVTTLLEASFCPFKRDSPICLYKVCVHVSVILSLYVPKYVVSYYLYKAVYLRELAQIMRVCVDLVILSSNTVLLVFQQGYL